MSAFDTPSTGVSFTKPQVESILLSCGIGIENGLVDVDVEETNRTYSFLSSSCDLIGFTRY
jgi:hypothetical protein